MIGTAIILAALASLVFFPWPLTALLTIASAFVTPLAPLALGLIIDALYYSHGAYAYPFFSLLGLALSIISYFLRRFLETSILRA